MTAHGKGQATTELVMLLPVFIIFLIGFLKVFGFLLLVQELDIATYYAVRRWQLESHHAGDDTNLYADIEMKLEKYFFGFGTPRAQFLGVDESQTPILGIERTPLWNTVSLTVTVTPLAGFSLGAGTPLLAAGNKPARFTMTRTKYVVNRDRPMAFGLPGLR